MPGRDGFLQLRQGLRQRDGQPGRRAGHEAHRPPVVGGDVRVRPAFLRPAPLVVPALADRFRPGVGDEVVIDVVHAGGHRVRVQHRLGEQPPAAPAGRRASAIAASRGRSVRSAGRAASPASGPASAGGQVLELLGRRRAQREAHADRRQQRQRPARPPAAAKIVPGAARAKKRAAASPLHTGSNTRLPSAAVRRPRERRRHAPGSGPGAGGLAVPAAAAPPPGSARRSRPAPRQAASSSSRPARWAGPQPPQHRGLLHAQPAGDLRVPHPRRPPRPGLLPRRRAQLPRPARRPDQRRRALPQRPLVQRRHVVLRQPQHRARPAGRGTPAAAAPPPPRSASPRRRRANRNSTADPAEDPRHPVRAGARRRSRGIWHALQDGSSRG